MRLPVFDMSATLTKILARKLSHREYLFVLSILFAVVSVLLAINPSYREAWALENLLVVGFVILIASTYRVFAMSRVSYTLIFIFLCLHEVGAHYTYAEVPYDEWSQLLFGGSLNELLGWERNHFDRLIHFSYGLLMAYPIREVFLRIVNVRGFWGYFLPLDLTMSTSMLFELLEWLAAIVFGGELGMTYLGTQGDEWDAHKDMALASLGALMAMCVTATMNYYLQRDFAAEWGDSFRVKAKRPLGEDEIERMRRRNGKKKQRSS
jgi:putative membrane protein